jgi:L-threonylcarbamoyladenylate synthase
LGKEDLIIDGGESEIGVESTIIDCSRALPRILRLGAVTEAMIREITPIDLDNDLNEIRVSGSLTRHYSPKAKLVVNREAKPGEGLIALADIATPNGVIRLAEPKTVTEYARALYSSRRRYEGFGNYRCDNSTGRWFSSSNSRSIIQSKCLDSPQTKSS